jgi:fluoride exporter
MAREGVPSMPWPVAASKAFRAATERASGLRMTPTLAIALGGALGSVGRYWLAVWALPISGTLPWGTILINVIGSFAIGLFGAMTLDTGRYPLPEVARLFFMVGICGGFTTFSSFSLQTLDLLRGGHVTRAFANIAVSVILCLVAVAIGYAAGGHFGHTAQVAEISIEEEAS